MPPETPQPDPSSSFSWGHADTQFFNELQPDLILDAVESLGHRCTGRCLALNSMENRVYEIEVEDPDGEEGLSYCIAKFYRPGRWNSDQILDEHDFLFDLKQQEIPAVAPLQDAEGESLHQTDEGELFYTVFPRIGGRNPDELDRIKLERMGRLMARVHNTGALQPAEHRIHLNHETYGWNSLDFLHESESIPEDLEERYIELADEICTRSEPLFRDVAIQRVHGDCHRGNLLWRMEELYLVDFDDMVMAPPVQDLWLLVPGRDEDSKRDFQILLDAYCEMRDFDYRSLALIEPLRALRYIHFSAWIAKRWDDPAFPKAFPHYGTRNYWMEQIQDLQECLELIRNA